MGLDMYLNARRHFYSYNNPQLSKLAYDVQNLFPELQGMTNDFDQSVIEELEIRVGYWRKANQIHNWFVENVQNGEDDCESYEVDREQLQALKEKCVTVLANRDSAEDSLPTKSGFFFGSYDYDEYYYSDLEATIQIIDKALSLPDSWYFTYRASW